MELTGDFMDDLSSLSKMNDGDIEKTISELMSNDKLLIKFLDEAIYTDNDEEIVGTDSITNEPINKKDIFNRIKKISRNNKINNLLDGDDNTK